MSQAWWGVIIAFAGAFAYALGAAIQQLDAVELGPTRALMGRLRWWIGGVISFTGASLHAVALSLAPLTVIQPISMTTLVYAVPLAAALHRRKPRRSELLGSAAVCVGLAGLMLMLPITHSYPRLADAPAAGFLVGIVLFILITQLIGRYFRGPGKAAWYAVGAGVATGTVSLFVRLVGAGVQTDLGHLLHWFTLVVPAMLVLATVLLQRSYSIGFFGVAYCVGQISDPVASVLAGATLLGEPMPMDPILIAPALLCGALLLSGTIVLGMGTPDTSPTRQVAPPARTPAAEKVPAKVG